MDTIIVVVGIFILGYLILYLSGRYYLNEGFSTSGFSGNMNSHEPIDTTNYVSSKSDVVIHKDGKQGPYEVLNTSASYSKPFITPESGYEQGNDDFDNFGEFERDVAREREGGADPTTETINAARRRDPYEWSSLPPSASRFQQQQAMFVNNSSSKVQEFVSEQDKRTMQVLPPDQEADEATETAILQAYKPRTTDSMTSIDSESVQELMNNLYSKKGLIPNVIKKYNNVYEVNSTREINPKIIFEDDASSTQGTQLNPTLRAGEVIVPPKVVSELVSMDKQLAGRQFNNYSSTTNEIDAFGPRMNWQ